MAVRHVYDPRARRRTAVAWFAAGFLAVLGLAATSLWGGRADAAGDREFAGVVGETTAGTAAVATALDPGLVAAFDRAAAAAAEAGHDLRITDGFRTAEEQAALFAAEIVERGSVEEASRWVFPPDRSMHVRGLAIDVGDGPAADWLEAAGARFGLCRTLAWEWWHFEWRPEWQAAGACPAPLDDP